MSDPGADDLRESELEDNDFEDNDFEDDDFDDEGLEDDIDGNRIRGATAREVLDYIARNIVDDPDSVVIEVEESRGGVILRLHVAPDDMGKVIGRRGRVAQSIRSLVRAAGAQEGVDANVDIVD